ncbi:DNA primase [Proteiniclasticum sp. SCR006]|uniref:DNA primase n=1 Tax=Proteiniclasticum aestuarii TaxID=2817862 RepID=A0A939KG06_9CLOT|nr:DNA primase [Proteiniclasticum aestuarii]MBO1263849.1 DNA primase [Proteiniclasticum aestuarii]
MYVAEEIIEKIKESNDIVDIISESVPLKRVGRNYWGLCPFHNEKTPSFSVTREKQLFKCFGCGEGGNVITFVMKSKNLEFNEALRFLADRANITLEESAENRKKNEKLEMYFKMHVDAARFFFRNLKDYKEIRDYFYKRGITDQTIRSFGLGFALNSWDSLLKYLKSMNYKEDDIVRCGLATKNEKGKVYDRFRNRIIFPVFDVRGRVIAFGARVMDDSKPKYLNSPETPIYNKGTHLYGLNFARKNSKEKSLIIVEGYMDCISLNQAGVKNVVASLGTALTKMQARLLKRNSEEVYISYDADNAGQAATVRGLDILSAEGIDVKVVQIPKGKDPDDYIRAEGVEKFHELLSHALPLIDYKILKAKDGLNIGEDQGRIHYAKRVVSILNNLDPIEKDVYVQKVSEDTGISESALMSLMKGDEEAVRIMDTSSIGKAVHIESAHVKAERALLKLLSEGPYLIERIHLDDFVLPSHRKIYEIITKYDGPKDNIRSFVESHCNDIETSKEWTIITELVEIPDIDVDILIDDFMKTIKHYKGILTQKKLMLEIRSLEKQGRTEESLEIAKKLIELQKTLGRY